jgi:hypothetical protein
VSVIRIAMEGPRTHDQVAVKSRKIMDAANTSRDVYADRGLSVR